MKKLLVKLCARRGESLIETLSAILVMALAAAMFVAMARSAVEINRKATQATQALYTQLSVAEEQAGASTGDGNVTVAFSDFTWTANPSPVSLTVPVWGEDGALQSYSLEEGTP